jgi:hypothetical protein
LPRNVRLGELFHVWRFDFRTPWSDRSESSVDDIQNRTR